MYNKIRQRRTSIKVNESAEGETIETKLERLVNNGDEIVDGKELLYSRPEDGIIAAFNIRHDHWDDAIENASIMAEKRSELDAAQLKKRQELLKKKEEEEKFLKDHAKKGIEEIKKLNQNDKPDNTGQ
ncbi:hypothetical protein [Tortoise microvirus 85]|nr:hypothetical protein [Tortoise microvirus 85]